MKVAEALLLRSDAQKRIEQLRERITRNAKVQEGDAPAENPTALLKEVEEIAQTLVTLVQRINRTNSVTALAGGQSISDAIAQRDDLRLRQSIYSGLAREASVTLGRYSKSEVKFQSTVDVVAIQRRADDLARQYRDLDALLQASNWQTDLVE